MDDIGKQFAAALRYLKKRDRQTAKWIAEKGGIEIRQAQRILSGESTPRGGTGGKIAAAFGMDYSEMLALGRKILESGELPEFGLNIRDIVGDVRRPMNELQRVGAAVKEAGRLGAAVKQAGIPMNDLRRMGVSIRETTAPARHEGNGEAMPRTVPANGRDTHHHIWDHPDLNEFIFVPMVETRLSAGDGAFVASDKLDGYYAIPTAWASSITTNIHNLVLMKVEGDSMFPTIQTDDTVLVDLGVRDITEGLIYALRIEDAVMLKRLSYRPCGRICVISDNKQEFPPYEVEAENLAVIGKIIFVGRTL